MLQNSRVSVCWAWARIRLKTPSLSLETQKAGCTSGTYVTLHWIAKTGWEGVCNLVYTAYMQSVSPAIWSVLVLHSQCVSGLHCCSVGRLMRNHWCVWKFWRWLRGCSSLQPHLTALPHCGRKMVITWVVSDRKRRGISLSLLLTRGGVPELVSVAVTVTEGA